MKRVCLSASVFLVLIALAGCATENQSIYLKPQCPGVMEAKYTSVPVKIDGSLNDAAWKNAAVYTMSMPADRATGGKKTRKWRRSSIGMG